MFEQSQVAFQPFTVRDAALGIARRKVLAAFVFVGTVLAVGVFTILCPKTYKSEARLFMRLGRESTGMDATATLGENPVVMMPQSREAEINSIIELIQAKQIYRKVVEQIGATRILKRKWKPPVEGEPAVVEEDSFLEGLWGGLMSNLASAGIVNDLPESEKAIIKLQKKVEIEAFEKSNVLTVSFKSHSPELAQDVVNAIVEEYVRQHVDLHRPPKAFEFLQEQAAGIEQKLLVKREELEGYKNRTGILDANSHRNILDERRATLEGDLLNTTAQAYALQTLVDELEKSTRDMTAVTTVAKTTGAGNEGADGMAQELYKLKNQRALLAAKYREGHAKVVAIDKQVAEAEQMLKVIEAQRVETIEGPNKIYEETAALLEQKRPELAAAQAKVKILQQQIEKFNEELDEFTKVETGFAKLTREVDVLEQNYRKYYANLEQARIDNEMQTKEISNIGIGQGATLNLKPYSPNKLINLIAAFVLGIGGACGLTVFLEYMSGDYIKLPTESVERTFRSETPAIEHAEYPETVPVVDSMSTVTSTSTARPPR